MVTDAYGWIELSHPDARSGNGAGPFVAIRIRVAPDASGRSFVYADEVVVGKRRYAGVFDMLTVEREVCASRLAQSVQRAIAREIARARDRSASERVTLPPPEDSDWLVRYVGTDRLPPYNRARAETRPTESPQTD
jgi:hypothetical protein